MFGVRDAERAVALEAVVHVQGSLQLLDHALVEHNLLPQVGLHHVFEIYLTPLVEVVHLGLQGEAHSPAALAHTVGLVLVHLALVTHTLALLHLGKGTWRDRRVKKLVTTRF